MATMVEDRTGTSLVSLLQQRHHHIRSLALHGTSDRLTSTNAISLRRQPGRTVEDHTQLEGEFDFSLVWDRDETGDSTAPSLFAALREQLGLRLRAASGKIPTVVVDQIERPTAN
ncbi:MAG TPA: TIGR03435 family protein [Bryobacteraceae bacterium]